MKHEEQRFSNAQSPGLFQRNVYDLIGRVIQQHGRITSSMTLESHAHGQTFGLEG